MFFGVPTVICPTENCPTAKSPTAKILRAVGNSLCSRREAFIYEKVVKKPFSYGQMKEGQPLYSLYRTFGLLFCLFGASEIESMHTDISVGCSESCRCSLTRPVTS